jgi:hypothetical protein
MLTHLRAPASSSLILSTLILAAAACGGNPRSEPPNPHAPAAVEVQNLGFTDMTIYAVGQSTNRVRLGLAVGNTTQLFPIPAFLVGRGGTVRFVADPVGANRQPVSEELSVEPGDTISLMIPPQ